MTVGAYLDMWQERYPRSRRTDQTNRGRIASQLAVEVDGRPLGDWPLSSLRTRHVRALVDSMLRDQGRAQTGATGVLGALSAMFEDAIVDELVAENPFRGVRVKASDPRIVRAPTEVRVFGWADMHRFAGGDPMLRTLVDCGLRLGELLPLERRDLDLAAGELHVRRTAWEGRVLAGTKTDHGEAAPGRVVPVPPALAGMLRRTPTRIDTPLLFPTPTGKLWRESNWRRAVWAKAREASGLDMRPHEARHSYTTLMLRAGVPATDLARITGHTVATLLGRYAHATGGSFDAVREAVG